MNNEEMKSEIKGNDNIINQIANQYHINNLINNKEEKVEKLKLDDKAFELLKNAVEEKNNNRILLIKDLGGNHIQCGNARFSVSSETLGEREMTYWESALQDLINYGLIEDVGYKGEVYKITREGYEYYDKQNKKRNSSITYNEDIREFVEYNPLKN